MRQGECGHAAAAWLGGCTLRAGRALIDRIGLCIGGTGDASPALPYVKGRADPDALVRRPELEVFPRLTTEGAGALNAVPLLIGLARVGHLA